MIVWTTCQIFSMFLCHNCLNCCFADIFKYICITVRPQHDNVTKWKYFSRYRPFVRGNHRSTVNSPHKGQWRGALMFSLIFAWINGWVNNCEAGDLRHHRAHYDVTVMRVMLMFRIFLCLLRLGAGRCYLWVSNHKFSKVWDEISYPCKNYDGWAV